MNPGVLQPEESKILVARSHFCCCCRDDSRMKRLRPWVSSVLMLFGSAPAPYITNTTDAAGFRGYRRCSGLCLKAAREAPGPKVPRRNLHRHLVSAAKARVLKVISHQKKKKKEKKDHCDAALGHQKPPVLGLALVIGGHSEVMAGNGFVTETELGQIDGITPWAALHW